MQSPSEEAPFPPPIKPEQLVYRLICLRCFVELRCLRIGLWECPQCRHRGQVTTELTGDTTIVEFAVVGIPYKYADKPLSFWSVEEVEWIQGVSEAARR